MTHFEYEQLIALSPAWNLRDIRRLSVRERKHWIAFFEWVQKQSAKRRDTPMT